MLLSIKADQALTYGIVLAIGDALNRLIQSYSYGRNFKVVFLDCSPFNRKECGDAYLKACQYGAPMIGYYCASQGLSQAEMDGMNYLEQEVLHLSDKFNPLRSSTQMPKDESGSSSSEPAGEPGAPKKDMEDLTEAGEQTQEDA